MARQAGTDVKMTSQVLRSLEAKRLVEREVDPHDSRARRVRATSAGARLAPRAIRVVEAADAQFFAPTGVADAATWLARLLADAPRPPAALKLPPTGGGYQAVQVDP